MSVGGKRPDRPGWFRPPTTLTDNTTDMQMFREEVSGLVAQVWTVSWLEEALQITDAHL